MTEDEMVVWHHRLDRHEFEQTLEVGDRQGHLACCSPRGHRASDTTERPNSKHQGVSLRGVNAFLCSDTPRDTGTTLQQ